MAKEEIDIFGGRGRPKFLDVGANAIKSVDKVLTYHGDESKKPLVDYEEQRKSLKAQEEQAVLEKKQKTEDKKKQKALEIVAAAQKQETKTKQEKQNAEAFEKIQHEKKVGSAEFPQSFYSPKVPEDIANSMAKEAVDARGGFIPSAAGSEKQIKAAKDYLKLWETEKPLEKLTGATEEAYKTYNQRRAQLMGESEMAAPDTNVGGNAVRQALGQVEEPIPSPLGTTPKETPYQIAEKSDEFVGETPRKIQELLAEYPDLKRQEIVDSFSFGRKLAIGILGGVAGRPNIFNELVDAKIKHYNDEFDYRLDKLVRSGTASAQATQQLFASKLQQDTLLERSLKGSIDLIKAQYDKTVAPLAKFDLISKLGGLEQNQQIVLEDIRNKTLAKQDLQRSYAEALRNHPDAVSVFNPITGQYEDVIAKSPEIKKEWTQGNLEKGIPPKGVVYKDAMENIADIFNILNGGTWTHVMNRRDMVLKFNGLVKLLYPLQAVEMTKTFDGASVENQRKILQQIQNGLEFEKRNSFKTAQIPATLLKDIQSRLKK
jgi:hypothetical protein